jgi:hypothetical protein
MEVLVLLVLKKAFVDQAGVWCVDRITGLLTRAARFTELIYDGQ